MSFRSGLPHTVLVAIVLLTPNSAYAARFWWFYITVDGKPAFAGGIGMNNTKAPPLTVLGEIHRAGIQLGADSSFDANTTGDITLKGDIVFSFSDLPDMHLQQLRLVYEQETRHLNWRVGGYFDWHLHPDDADMIIKHYGAPARKGKADYRLAKLMGLSALGVILIATVQLVRRNRMKQGSAADFTS